MTPVLRGLQDESPRTRVQKSVVGVFILVVERGSKDGSVSTVLLEATFRIHGHVARSTKPDEPWIRNWLV